MSPLKVLEQNSNMMKRYKKSKSRVLFRALLVLKVLLSEINQIKQRKKIDISGEIY